jgi:L-lactate permease
MSRRHTSSYPTTGHDDHDGYDGRGGHDGYGGSGDTPAVPARRSAPASVHVIALIGYLAGLAFLAMGAGAWRYTLGGDQPTGDSPYVRLVINLREIGLAAGAVLVFVGLFVLALTRKLQRGRRWVRALVVVASAFSITFTLYEGILGPGGGNALFGLVLPVICVVLLNLPAARSWYRDRATDRRRPAGR